MSGVLEGIRVLDFGRYIAGPYCATMLADFGAEVIRIEKRGGSEDRFTLALGSDGTGARFLQVARNKKSLTLDPGKPAAREVVRRLVASADVVIVTMPLPALRAAGLDYETLAAINPRAVYTMISAFGSDGPYSERIGFDVLGQAMSGAMYISGDERRPARLQVPYVDFSTALFATVGTLTALMERQRSGQGQMVEASLFTSAVTLNNAFLMEQDLLHPDHKPQGNRGFQTAPNDAFQTRDGWIVVMVLGAPLFARWAELMGVPEWVDDPRYATDQLRADHADVIGARMAEWCHRRTTAESLAELERARIPAGPVYTPQQVLDDPHFQERQILKRVDYPTLPGPALVSDTPVRLSRSPHGIRQRPPLLGEHTEQILNELGFGSEEIEALRKARAI